MGKGYKFYHCSAFKGRSSNEIELQISCRNFFLYSRCCETFAAYSNGRKP